MQIVYGPYPMTVAQLAAWAEEQSALNPLQCAVALHNLDYPRPVRRAEPKEWR
jgi:hypothetical protein